MSRSLSSEITNALDDPEIRPFFAVDLEFDTTTLRFWTGLGDKTINGETYTGAGNLLAISRMEETSEIAARGVSITLSGIPSNTLSLALSTPYQGRVCKIYFGIMSGSIDYTEIFSGYMDEMNISEGADAATIELKVENKLIDLERQRVARYTSSYQKSIFPGDKGFDFVESLQDKRVSWGR